MSEMSVREAVVSIWDVVEQARTLSLTFRKGGKWGSLDTVRSLVMYAVENPSRRKRTPMKVDEMVSHWVRIVRGLSTAHDRTTLDALEFEMDEHLTPMLSAPVKQIREFYEQLTVALEKDDTIPFFVWAWFRSWGEVVLKPAPDGDILSLKSQLATEIAQMVEEGVRPDLSRAIAGALQWRSEENLQRIKTAVEAGGKPRMVGRESCLFLEVDTGHGIERVML